MTAAFGTTRYLVYHYAGTVQKRRTCRGVWGVPCIAADQGFEVVQLSLDGQTSDEMEWAIPSRVLMSRARGLTCPCQPCLQRYLSDAAQSRLQCHLGQDRTGQAPPQLRDPYIRTRYRTYLGIIVQICRSPGLIA